MPTLETAPTQAVPDIMLTQTRIIRASRARVYEAWTDPEILKEWFGPAGRHCPNAAMDVRVGGAYRIEVMPDAPTPSASGTACEQGRSAAIGSFTKVVPNELLQFTWSPDWNLGEKSVVTVSLKDVEGGTAVTILHEGFLTEGSRDGHGQGWAGCLDKLTAKLQN